jgi:hypothetical protein
LRRIDRIERQTVVKGDRSPAAGTLTLIHRFVERRLGEVRPHLRGTHL